MIEALQLLSVIFCLFGMAFFNGIETGVTAINKIRLRHFVRQGSPAALILQDFLDNTDRLLGTTLMGTNLNLVIASVFAASLSEKWFGHRGEALSTFLLAAVTTVFCEYIPKAWFSGRPYYRSAAFAPLLLMADRIMKPLAAVVVALTRLFVRSASRSFVKPLPFVSRDDLKMLTDDGERHGVLSRRETWMINRVFELSGKKLADIMTPVSKVVSVRSDMAVSEFLSFVRTSPFTRFPVIDSESGGYKGVVNVLYVLSSVTKGVKDGVVGDIVRPPQFVRESTPVDDIFPLMRRSRQPMYLVTGNAEQVVGLVTTEDILEEIVGRLQ